MSTPHRRRHIYHHISLSFSAPGTVVPQLYEWVSTGFPIPVVVHHYSVSTTFPPPSLSSSTSSDTLFSFLHSDSDPNDSLLDEFAELERHATSSESLVESLRRRLHRIAFPSGNEEVDRENEEVVHVVDPWTTWLPPTPPLGTRIIPGSETAPATWLLSLGLAPSELLHRLNGGDQDLGFIDEGDEREPGQTARPGRLCEELPDDETEFAGCMDEDQSSHEGARLCWACRAILQRYARRRNRGS